MCGIVGYIGSKKVVPVIIEGLRKLEYRGYDSAGIAVVGTDGKLQLRRAPGKLRNLEEAIAAVADRRDIRHRAYALGYARSSNRRKCAPAPRLHGGNTWWCTTGSSRTTSS